MKILALDSATGACSVALWHDGAILARRFAVMDRGQSEVLIPMVREVLAEAGADFPSIDVFGVTVGPGAFTGLRIGLAAARGMALASGRPLVGVSTFEAVAHGVPAGGAGGPAGAGRRRVRVEKIFSSNRSITNLLRWTSHGRCGRKIWSCPIRLYLWPVMVPRACARCSTARPETPVAWRLGPMCGLPPALAFPMRRMWRGWWHRAARLRPERRLRSPSTCARRMSRCQRRKCDDAAPRGSG